MKMMGLLPSCAVMHHVIYLSFAALRGWRTIDIPYRQGDDTSAQRMPHDRNINAISS
jgi:hypothetical protein